MLMGRPVNGVANRMGPEALRWLTSARRCSRGRTFRRYESTVKRALRASSPVKVETLMKSGDGDLVVIVDPCGKE